MKVKWTRKVLENLENAIEYIATDKPMAAQNVAQKIWESAQMLAKQPGMGRPGRVSGTRERVISNSPFILPYMAKDGTIFILRVMHTSMKWPKKLLKRLWCK